MAEINFDITPPISANKIIKDNQPQEIENKYVSQSEHADALYENFSSHTITERIKVEVSGLEKSTGQVNDSISMLETIEGLSNKISFALNQMKGLAAQAAEKNLGVTDRAVLDLEFGQLFTGIQNIATDSVWGSMIIMSGGDRKAEALVSSALGGEGRSGKIEDKVSSATLKSWDPSTAIRANVIQQTVDPVTGLQHVGGNQFTSDGLIDGGDDLPLGDSNMLAYDRSGNDNSISKGAANQSARSTETQAFGSAVLWAGNHGVPSRLNILSKINAEYVLANIDKAISAVSDERIKLGSYISKLETAGDDLANVSAGHSPSSSLINDAGFAAQTSESSRVDIIAKEGLGMSAQSNAANQAILTFLMN